MSGLVKLVKKSWNRLKKNTKKLMSNKIFKVVLIAAAVIFTGGAALAAMGAAGGGFMATMGAAFQGGLSALGSVGSAIWTGVKTAGTAIKGFMTGAGGGAGAGGQALSASQAAAINLPTAVAAGAPNVATAVAPSLMSTALSNPVVQSSLVTTGGNMATGYAQGRAQQEQLEMDEKRRMRRDQYGYDGYGNKTGELINPVERLAQIRQNQDPGLRQGMQVTLDNGPGVQSPGDDLESAMRKRLMGNMGAPAHA